MRRSDVVKRRGSNGFVRCRVDDGHVIWIAAQRSLGNVAVERGPVGQGGREDVVPEVGVLWAAQNSVEVVCVRGGETLEAHGGAGEEFELGEGRVGAFYIWAQGVALRWGGGGCHVWGFVLSGDNPIRVFSRDSILAG